MKKNSDKKTLLEMMHKVGGMPLKENYEEKPLNSSSEQTGMIKSNGSGGFETKIEQAHYDHSPRNPSLPISDTTYEGKPTIEWNLPSVEAAIKHIRSFGFQGRITLDGKEIDSGTLNQNENYPMGAEPEYAGDDAPYNQNDNDDSYEPDPDEGRDDDMSEYNDSRDLGSTQDSEYVASTSGTEAADKVALNWESIKGNIHPHDEIQSFYRFNQSFMQAFNERIKRIIIEKGYSDGSVPEPD